MARQKQTKLYGLFAQSRCGNIYGFVEHTFSMGWRQDYVRVWEKESAEHYLADYLKSKKNRVYRHTTEGKDTGEFAIKIPSNDGAEESVHDIVKFFLVRVNNQNSPIQINMKNRRKASKFYWRNRPFKQIEVVRVMDTKIQEALNSVMELDIPAQQKMYHLAEKFAELDPSKPMCEHRIMAGVLLNEAYKGALQRVTRPTHITEEDAKVFDKIRAQIEEEFPPESF